MKGIFYTNFKKKTRNGKSQIKKNKKGERVAEGDGKRAKKLTLAPSLEGGGWGWV